MESDSKDTAFRICYVNEVVGIMFRQGLGLIATDYKMAWEASYGLRPVFKLKSGIKVTDGSGTESSPYTLGT